MAKTKEPVLLTMEKEMEIRAKGFTAVCGIDEAGRGPLAGPVVAAAVILPEDIQLPGVNDSKKITEKKREILFDFVKEHALAYGIGEASETEIDEMAAQYPEYGFEKHKGYGTKAHYAAIEQYGICPLHRKTFLKKVLNHQ